jgi:hypothetical protein
MKPVFARAPGLMILFLFMLLLHSDAQSIKGKVIDAISRLPVEGVTVTLLPSRVSGMTDPLGKFSIKTAGQSPIDISFSSAGFESRVLSLSALRNAGYQVTLEARTMELSTVTIAARENNPYKSISRTDIALRAINNSQEVLRIIPGVVIGQHQGGGKAEQIFLRGFDADHGTDLRLDVDGMPINMVSHAHGQGYADSHFIIPETIQTVDFKKGPYTASKGDFATTGFVDFNTKNALSENTIKLEGGMFHTYRALGMFNLLNAKAKEKQQSWYAASEYRYSDAYFDAPQHFKRFNLFTKYNGKVSEHNYLVLSATTFRSKWDASGQIPERAVEKNLIGFYGAIDPHEGGLTCRTNVNAQLLTSLTNGDIIKNQLYYSNSHFDLHTNFTFFLLDTVNGDEIRQKEARNLSGYNGSYQHIAYLGTTQLNTEAGLNIRLDRTYNSELSHTVDRFTLLGRIKLGDITELNIAPYLSETFNFKNHLSINAGLRFDQFYNTYNNKLGNDTALARTGVYKANAHTISPKLNFYYHVNDNTQFYLSTGKGFHSNDARAVVAENGYQVLPAAYSADLGTVFKPCPDMIVNAAIWYIYLQQEFVYSGDGGLVEFNGKTRRVGFDFSGRYQPVKSLYVDLDINFAHGRSIEHSKGQNYIPLAPVWSSTAGLTYTNKKGFNGSLRYRFVGNRPGNQDYSLTAKGYFVTDAVVNYTRPRYEIGLVINNFFNTRWKETQFDTETRLKSEAQPVDEICFTPGTPFAAKLSFAIKF